MIFREATQSDLEEVAKTSISRGCKEFPASIDYVYALEDDGKVLGVGGIKKLNLTTAWVWLEMAEAAMKRKYFACRVIYEWLGKLVEVHGLTRLMAAIDPTFEEAVRLAEHLDFRRESIMPCYFGTKPAFLYAKCYALHNDSASTKERLKGGVQANNLGDDKVVPENHNVRKSK